jgi:hypothetical protein
MRRFALSIPNRKSKLQGDQLLTTNEYEPPLTGNHDYRCRTHAILGAI